MERFPLKVVLVLLLSSSLCGCGATEPEVSFDRLEMDRVKTVAILPFSDAPGADGGYSGKTMTSLVTQQFVSIPNYQVVEREKIKAIIEEQDFQLSMIQDNSQVARLGKLIGADTVVVGAATQYTSSSVPMMFGDIFTVGVSMRMVRVDTAKICFAGSCTQNGTSYEEAGRRSVSLLMKKLNQVYDDKNN
jgi:curli biogenesis system outer membrane secretion channel CsgG